MRSIFILLGVVCLVGIVLPVCAPAPEPESQAAVETQFDQEAEEAAIRAVSAQLFAAVNSHNASEFAALFVEDIESWTGEVRGRTAWEEDWSNYWERAKDFQVNLTEEIGIIFVTPDVAIHKYREEGTGRIGEDGQPLPPWKGLAADIYVKKEGQWLCAALFSAQ